MWEGFFFEWELLIVKVDVVWFLFYLDIVGLVLLIYWFNWGSIWLGFDECSGFLYIVVWYGYF